MILTTAQAQEAADLMKTAANISHDMPASFSMVERVKVVHESKCSPAVMVWQTIGGIAHGEEKYTDRAQFLAAYGVQ